MLHRLPALTWITGVHWIWVTTTSNGVCVGVHEMIKCLQCVYLISCIYDTIESCNRKHTCRILVTMEVDHHPQKGE